MNWNGGALSRSRNAITSLSTVQKGHFAKARGKPQKIRQSLLDVDFSTFSHVATEKRRLSPQSQAQPLLCPPNHGSHTSPSPLNKQHETSFIQLSSPPTLNDDAISTETRVKEVKISAEDRLEAQKHELLTLKDWCGLKSTRPPSVIFPVIADVDQIGKRRPLGKEHHDRHTGQGVKRQISGLSVAEEPEEPKKRKVQANNFHGVSNSEDGNTLPARDQTLPEQTAKHIRLFSNSDKLKFTAVASKNNSPSSNSDENLFDYDTFDHGSCKRAPMSRMSLSSQNSLPLRPSPRRNVLTANDIVCPESDEKLKSIRKLSPEHSRYRFQENFDSGFSRESPLSPMDDTSNVCTVFENFPSETNEPSHNRTPLAPSSMNNDFVDDGAISPVPYDRHSIVGLDYTSFETKAKPTLASKADTARANTIERASPLEEKEPEVSPFGKATLSYLNTLQTQSVVQTSDRAGNSIEETDIKEKSEPPSVLHDRTIAQNESSPSLEAGWRNFVLGDVDDSNNDDQDFISQASPELCYQEKPSFMDAEPSFCSPSTDEPQRSPGIPPVIFRKPPRFSGCQNAPSGESEGSHPSILVSKWGKLRRQSKRPVTAQEDNIED